MANYPTTTDTAASLFKTANQARSTLLSAVDALDIAGDTFDVVNGNIFPTDNFLVSLPGEIILISTRTGTTMTIGARAQEATTALTHAANTAIANTFTSLTRDVIRDTVVDVQSYLNRYRGIALTSDTTDPTVLTPTDGDQHIVALGAIGAWAGQDNNLAFRRAGVWEFITVLTGFEVYVLGIAEGLFFDGTNWINEHPLIQDPTQQPIVTGQVVIQRRKFFRATTDIPAGTPFDAADYEELSASAETWDNTLPYEIGDVVKHRGRLFVSLTQHTNLEPGLNVNDWEHADEFWDWDVTRNYNQGNIVRHNNKLWYANGDTLVGDEPSVAGVWVFADSVSLGDLADFTITAPQPRQILQRDDSNTFWENHDPDFFDTEFRITDEATESKQASFTVDDVASGTTRDIRVPNYDVNLNAVPSDWITAQNYTIGAIVLGPDGTQLHESLSVHTSGVFDTDYSAGNWKPIGGMYRGAFNDNYRYFNTQTVLFGGQAWRAIQDVPPLTGDPDTVPLFWIRTVTTVTDASFTIIDDVDNTKGLAFQVSEVTTVNTRTLTAPDRDVNMGRIIDDYTPGFNYNLGDHVIDNAIIYKNLNPIIGAPGILAPVDWQQITNPTFVIPPGRQVLQISTSAALTVADINNSTIYIVSNAAANITLILPAGSVILGAHITFVKDANATGDLTIQAGLGANLNGVNGGAETILNENEITECFNSASLSSDFILDVSDPAQNLDYISGVNYAIGDTVVFNNQIWRAVNTIVNSPVLFTYNVDWKLQDSDGDILTIDMSLAPAIGGFVTVIGPCEPDALFHIAIELRNNAGDIQLLTASINSQVTNNRANVTVINSAWINNRMFDQISVEFLANQLLVSLRSTLTDDIIYFSGRVYGRTTSTASADFEFNNPIVTRPGGVAVVDSAPLEQNSTFSLNRLSDVVSPTPNDQDVLTFETSSGDWIPATVARQLNDLSDVINTAPILYDVLEYDGTEYVNVRNSSISVGDIVFVVGALEWREVVNTTGTGGGCVVTVNTFDNGVAAQTTTFSVVWDFNTGEIQQLSSTSPTGFDQIRIVRLAGDTDMSVQVRNVTAGTMERTSVTITGAPTAAFDNLHPIPYTAAAGGTIIATEVILVGGAALTVGKLTDVDDNLGIGLQTGMVPRYDLGLLEYVVEHLELDDINSVDVTTTPPVLNDVLTFDAGGDWVPQAPQAQVQVLDDLGDVDTTSSPPVRGDILSFDSVNWLPDVAAATTGRFTNLAVTNDNWYQMATSVSRNVSGIICIQSFDSGVTSQSTVLSFATTSATAQITQLTSTNSGTFDEVRIVILGTNDLSIQLLANGTRTLENFTVTLLNAPISSGVILPSPLVGGAGGTILGTADIGTGTTGLTLDELIDVDLQTFTPTLDEVLTFNGTLWQSKPVVHVQVLDDLSDVDSPTPVQDSRLRYDNAAGSWIEVSSLMFRDQTARTTTLDAGDKTIRTIPITVPAMYRGRTVLLRVSCIQQAIGTGLDQTQPLALLYTILVDSLLSFRDRVTTTSDTSAGFNIRMILPLPKLEMEYTVPAGAGPLAINVDIQLRREGGASFTCTDGEFNSYGTVEIVGELS